jgi:hypothetical protein
MILDMECMMTEDPNGRVRALWMSCRSGEMGRTVETRMIRDRTSER